MKNELYPFMRLLTRLQSCCQQNIDAVRERAGLSEAEYRCIVEMPDSPVTTGELSKLMQLSPSRGSRVVEGLVSRGLLERTASQDDRRVASLRLSPAGTVLKKKVNTLLTECERRVVAQLDENDLSRALDGMQVALQALQEKVAV